MHERITINGYSYDKTVYEHEYNGQDVVHEIVVVRDDEADICTCGLVLPADVDRRQALGHVDPVTKRPVSALVLTVPRQPWYRIICQRCAWNQARPTLHLATMSRRTHRCFEPPVPIHPGTHRLHTTGGLLSAVFARTGWTVSENDPRVPQFLDRVIELMRQHSEGRINIDTLQDTLRREFPLE